MQTGNKKEIKIAFVDFWPTINFDGFLIYQILNKKYKLVISDEPDFVFSADFGNKHLNYPNAIQVHFSGENMTPDFNFIDYGIGCHHIDFNNRYLHFPLSVMGWSDRKQFYKTNNKNLTKRKFCNFIYSNVNLADPIRTKFFEKLCKYKKVDSAGSVLNNVGYRVKNKIKFIKNYKFTIAFENSSVKGYSTEKIVDPLVASSMPIYWGDPLIKNVFNSQSFVNVNDFSSIDEAIDYIIMLDKNDDLYLEKLNSYPFIKQNLYEEYYNKLENFLENIIEQKEKQTPMYGWVLDYKNKLTDSEKRGGVGIKNRPQKNIFSNFSLAYLMKKMKKKHTK